MCPQKYVCVCVCGLLIIGWGGAGITHLMRCLNPAKDLQQRVSDHVAFGSFRGSYDDDADEEGQSWVRVHK